MLLTKATLALIASSTFSGIATAIPIEGSHSLRAATEDGTLELQRSLLSDAQTEALRAVARAIEADVLGNVEARAVTKSKSKTSGTTSSNAAAEKEAEEEKEKAAADASSKAAAAAASSKAAAAAAAAASPKAAEATTSTHAAAAAEATTTAAHPAAATPETKSSTSSTVAAAAAAATDKAKTTEETTKEADKTTSTENKAGTSTEDEPAAEKSDGMFKSFIKTAGQNVGDNVAQSIGTEAGTLADDAMAKVEATNFTQKWEDTKSKVEGFFKARDLPTILPKQVDAPSAAFTQIPKL